MRGLLVAEITDVGFVPKTQNEYFQEQRDILLGIDPDWNLDPSTPDGLKIAKDAEIFGNLDEAIQAAYNSKDPAKASGVELDVICALTGSERGEGTFSTVNLEVSGSAGTVIPAGSIVDSGVGTEQWATDSQVTINVSGGGTVGATCLSVGAVDVDPNTLTRIVSTVGGWQSVTNPTVATLGTERQTDESLRIERELSVSRAGNNQVDSMIGEIFSLDGVRRVRIYENSTDATDANGIPARSIAVIVDGGQNEDIAKAIFRKKAAGCGLFGLASSVTINDVYDLYPTNYATITFNRPEYIDQVINLSIFNDGTLPANVIDIIKDSIISYAEGSLISSLVGFNYRGYDIGQGVPVNQLLTPINKVIGSFGYSYVQNLEIEGVAGAVSPISFDQIARFTSSNINIAINS